MPSASAISVSVIPARSSSRYQSALERASRDTSRPNTIPTRPRAMSAVIRAKPERAVPAEPETPRSSSITSTARRDQPNSTARSTSAYWRSVDSTLRSVWPGVDWRTYTTAARPRWAGRILGCPATGRAWSVVSVIVVFLLVCWFDELCHQPGEHRDRVGLLVGSEVLPRERRCRAQPGQWQRWLHAEPPQWARLHPRTAALRRGG